MGELKDLGEDIFLYEGAADALPAPLTNRFRFLNKLWLPCQLSELSEPQILIVNRFRERAHSIDPQFSAAQNSRRALLDAVQNSENLDIVEIGCGKFPLAAQLSSKSYSAIEIDDIAIAFCQSQGISACRVEQSTAPDCSIDLILSMYALHFAISEQLLAFLARVSRPESVLAFNLIIDDTRASLATFVRLSTRWPLIRIVKTQSMPTKEYFLVMSSQHNVSVSRAENLTRRLSKSLDDIAQTKN